MNGHVIKYRWKNDEPFFSLRDKKIKDVNLFGQKLDFTAGKKFCIGYSKNNKSLECPNNRNIESGRQCNECMLNDHFFMCVKCTGEKCINPKRREDCKNDNFFIYLATFGDILKVGISYEYRLKARLIEQGATFGAKIAYVQDGLIVRKLEQQIKENLGIVDRLRGKEKSKNIITDPNKEMSNIIRAIKKLQNNGFNEHLIEPEIYDFRNYYKIDYLESNPSYIEIKENEKIQGEVLAVKGNIIIIDNGDLISFNAHDLIGREVF